MKKLELEVKILNINEIEFIKKLESLGAVFKSSEKQFLYTYDLATIYGRFIDILTILNDNESIIKYETALERLKLLFFELDNLLTVDNKDELKLIINNDNFIELLNEEKLLEIINRKEVIDFIDQFHNNSNKWIRLRQTNDKTMLAVKHKLANNDSNFQQLLETEIEVPNIKEANELLQALGFSYKSYQEKKRVTYLFEGYKIDIDTWPGIPTFFEIEGDDEEEIASVLNKLDYSFNETVSGTADDIYQIYGKSMFDKRELIFEDFN